MTRREPSRVLGTIAACAVIGATFATPTLAQAGQSSSDWPQWRGPNHDGISTEKGWSPKRKAELWYAFVGTGYAAVSIVGDNLYTAGHDPEAGKDTVYCIEADTGLVNWSASYECDTSNTMDRMHGGGTLTTPAVDGDNVYMGNREGRLYCFDAKTGKQKWSKDVAREYRVRPSRWGFAASPRIVDDMVIMNQGRVFAFSKDGKLLWKTERDYRDCYSTPTDFTVDGKKLLAVFNSVGLVILDRKTGEELAVHEFTNRSRVNAASPVVIGNKIFISSGYNKGCAMLEFTGDALKLLWESKVMRTQKSGVIYMNGHLFGFDQRGLECVDLNGEVKWTQRMTDGALSGGDGKLIIVSGNGDLVIAEATPEEYRELSRHKTLGGGVCWTVPVVSAGRIYCRNSKGDLVCVDHRGQKGLK